MTILFACGEDIGFTKQGICSVDTTAGSFRSAYSRYGLSVGGTVGTTLSDGWYATLASASSSFWLGTQCFFNSTNAASTTFKVIALRLGANSKIELRATVTNNLNVSGIGIYKVTNGGVSTLLGVASALPTDSALMKIDLNVNYSTSGYVRLYYNSALVFDSGTADVTTDGSTTLDGFFLGSAHNSSGRSVVWSEIIAHTSDTRSMSLVTQDYGITDSSNSRYVINYVAGTPILEASTVVTGGVNIVSAGSATLRSDVVPLNQNLSNANQWCIDFFINPASVTGSFNYVFDLRPITGGGGITWSVNISTTGKVNFSIPSNTALTSTASIPVNTETHVAVIRNGTTYSLYINGALDSSFTRTTAFSSVGFDTTSTVTLHGNWAGVLNTAPGNKLGLLRFTVGDQRWTAPFTRPSNISQYKPASAGGSDSLFNLVQMLISGGAIDSSNTFDSGTLTDVTELGLNDATVLRSATAGQALVASAGGGRINSINQGVVGVAHYARALRTTTGPQTIAIGVGSGGTTVWAANQSLDTAFATKQFAWDLNPVTGQQWTIAQLRSPQFQIGVKSGT